MSDIIEKNKSIARKKDGNFGKYESDTGGGEPIKGGGRGQWERNNYKEKREDSQPRTNDGKFTYNSVNGKPLKDVSKSHGKSRGTTVPPVLTGGVNGIQQPKTDKEGKEWVSEDFKRWAEKNKWATGEGAKVIGFDGKIKLAPEPMFEIAKEFAPDKKTFGKQKEGKYVEGSGEDIDEWKSKVGRHSGLEERAISEAEARGKLGKVFVKSDAKGKSGNIYETKSGISHFTKNTPAPKVEAPGGGNGPTTPAPEMPKAPEKSDVEQLKEGLNERGINTEGMSDATLKELAAAFNLIK